MICHFFRSQPLCFAVARIFVSCVTRPDVTGELPPKNFDALSSSLSRRSGHWRLLRGKTPKNLRIFFCDVSKTADGPSFTCIKFPHAADTASKGGMYLSVTALIRTVILYLILIVGLRLTGKRQIGELEPIELVLTMLLSDLASVPMQNFGIPLLNGLVPIVTLLSLSMLLSWCSLHRLRKQRSMTRPQKSQTCGR